MHMNIIFWIIRMKCNILKEMLHKIVRESLCTAYKSTVQTEQAIAVIS